MAHGIAECTLLRRCEGLRLRFQQRDTGSGNWEELAPGRGCDYAWEEPMGPRRLRVWLDAAAVGLRDPTVHEYGLDAIRVRGCKGFAAITLATLCCLLYHSLHLARVHVMTLCLRCALRLHSARSKPISLRHVPGIKICCMIAQSLDARSNLCCMTMHLHT